MPLLSHPGTPDYQERIAQGQRPLDGLEPHDLTFIYAAIFLFLAPPAIWLLVKACVRDASGGTLVALLLLVVMVLALPARVVYVILRRRMQTGIWSLKAKPDERLKLHAKWTNQTPSQQKRFSFSLASTDLVLLAFSLLVIAAFFKPHGSLHDRGDYIYTIIWSLIGARSTWTIYRKYLRKPRIAA